jgi:excinuclease UvrABC nuclease subunit
VNPLDRLLNIGFRRVGEWRLVSNKVHFVSDADVLASDVLYAFVAGRDVLYVGKTTKSLKNRLYGYSNPGPSQNTNIACNKKILEEIVRGKAIEVYARFGENSQQRIGTFQISEAAALEDAIIRDLQPPWNRTGRRIIR